METHPDFRQILPATATTTESLTSTDVVFLQDEIEEQDKFVSPFFPPEFEYVLPSNGHRYVLVLDRTLSVSFPSFSSSFLLNSKKEIFFFWWMDRVEDGVCYVVHFTVGFTPCHHQATTVKLIWASSFHPPAATATIQPIRISSSLDGLKWRQIIVTVLSVASLDDHCHLYHHNIISCRPIGPMGSSGKNFLSLSLYEKISFFSVDDAF